MTLKATNEQIIHLVWIPPEGNDDLPAEISRNVVLWRETHPDFEIKIWSLDEVRKLDGGDLLKRSFLAVDECKLIAMKSDIVRLLLLWKFGGVYTDLKNRPNLRFLDNLRDVQKFVICEHAPTIPEYRGKLMNSFLISGSNNSFVEACLERVCMNVINRAGNNVTAVTGAGPIAATLRSWPNEKDVTIIPSEIAWGTKEDHSKGWMKRIAASYNGKSMQHHWTHLQKTVGLFND